MIRTFFGILGGFLLTGIVLAPGILLMIWVIGPDPVPTWRWISGMAVLLVYVAGMLTVADHVDF